MTTATPPSVGFDCDLLIESRGGDGNVGCRGLSAAPPAQHGSSCRELNTAVGQRGYAQHNREDQCQPNGAGNGGCQAQPPIGTRPEGPPRRTQRHLTEVG